MVNQSTKSEVSRFARYEPINGQSSSCDESVFPKWAWSGSREQFLHCGLKKISPQQVVGIQVISTTRPWSVCL